MTSTIDADRARYVITVARRHGVTSSMLRAPAVVAAPPACTGVDIADRSADIASGVAAEPSLPMLIFGVPDGRLRHANSAAKALFGDVGGPLTGRHVQDLVRVPEPGGIDLALAALSSGSADSFRGRRTMLVTGHPVETLVAVRTMQLPTGSIAVWTLLPAEDRLLYGDERSGSFWRSNIELALGTLGSDRCVNGGDEPVESMFHPHDAEALRAAHATAARGLASASVYVRWRARPGTWLDVECSMFATGSADPAEAVAFTVTQISSAGRKTMADARVVELEGHLGHIASELRRARVESADREPVNQVAVTRLDGLTRRQREVVCRLVRGERVPAIAKAMFVSRSTVRNHLSGAFRQFGVNTQSDLVQLFQRSTNQTNLG
jgi:DNA-binding CsgD family transcriptional regulator